jgi:hypothetical protein
MVVYFYTEDVVIISLLQQRKRWKQCKIYWMFFNTTKNRQKMVGIAMILSAAPTGIPIAVRMDQACCD